MKQLFAILCVLFLNISSQAQETVLDRQVNLSLTNVRVGSFIDTLTQMLSVSFSYDADAVPIDSIVSVSVQNISLRNVLYQVLGEECVEVSSLMGQVVISRAEPTVRPRREYIHLSGQLVDIRSGEPLPMANVSILNEPLGTITNQAGNFEFVVPRKFEGAPLVFSMLGYARERMGVPSNDTTFVVMMVPTDVRLPEVRIPFLKAENVIGKVRENMAQNYLTTEVALTGFFRETVLQDDHYVQVSEAIIEIFKDSYLQPLNFESVRFIKGRKLEDLQKMQNVLFRLQGGPYHFSRLDVARYQDFLPKPDENNVYLYSYEGIEYVDGQPVYRIAFRPILDTGELLYEGELRISVKGYAVVGATFGMTKKTLEYSKNYLVRKDSKRYKAKPFYARYIVEYRPYKGKWILSHVRGEIKVKVVDKSNKVNSNFTAVTELLISDLKPADGRKLKYSESFKANYVLADQITEYDAGFWENYNIIYPGEELEKVFKLDWQK